MLTKHSKASKIVKRKRAFYKVLTNVIESAFSHRARLIMIPTKRS